MQRRVHPSTARHRSRRLGRRPGGTTLAGPLPGGHPGGPEDHDHLPQSRRTVHDRAGQPYRQTRSWYLVAKRADESIHTYRLSRITSASLTDDAFTRPTDFDLSAYWADAQSRFRQRCRRTRIVLRARRHAVRRFQPTAPVTTDTDGWSVVQADLENPDEACAAVLAQAGDAVVITPTELTDMIRRAATGSSNPPHPRHLAEPAICAAGFNQHGVVARAPRHKRRDTTLQTSLGSRCCDGCLRSAWRSRGPC